MTKQVNYTADQTAELVQAYTSAKTDAERKEVVKLFAGVIGKTEASIRAKLSAEKVYVKPQRLTKGGKAIVKKAELADKIADLIGKDREVMGSLDKATKVALEAIIEFIEG